MSKLIKCLSIVPLLGFLFMKVYAPLMSEKEIDKAALAMCKNSNLTQQENLPGAKKNKKTVNITIFAPTDSKN